MVDAKSKTVAMASANDNVLLFFLVVEGTSACSQFPVLSWQQDQLVPGTENCELRTAVS